jgi:hypothetical protein
VASAPEADACGASFGRKPKRAPSLSFERVLIIHDPATETQHFIREVAFKGGQETFGFVVPTPTKPEVFKVKASPFDKLEATFPFAPPRQRGMTSGRLPGVALQLVARRHPTSSGWAACSFCSRRPMPLPRQGLKDNKLGSARERQAARRVRRARFFSTSRSLRADQGHERDGSLKAETAHQLQDAGVLTRIASPRTPRTQKKPKSARWRSAVSPRAAPVAATKEGGKDVWGTRSEGWRRDKMPGSIIANTLSDDDKKLVDEKQTYFVQPLEDQKTKRTDYGDVVFLPEEGVPAASREKVAVLVSKLIAPGVKVGGK